MDRIIINNKRRASQLALLPIRRLKNQTQQNSEAGGKSGHVWAPEETSLEGQGVSWGVQWARFHMGID